MTELLAQVIPHGRENAISREKLARDLGMTDRRMREAIAKANADGLAILNLGDGKGYYQPETLDEKYSYCKKERARAISIFEKLSPIYAELKEAGYEM